MITRTGYVLVSSLILISFISLFLSITWIYLFCLFLYFFVFYDAIIFRRNSKRLKNLSLNRLIESTAVYYNFPFKVKLRITNMDKRSIKHLLIIEEIPLGFSILEGKTIFWGEIKNSVEIEYTLKSLQIGVHEFKNVTIIIFDPLILFFKKIKVPLYTKVEVMPMINMPLTIPYIRTLGFVKEYGFKESKVKGIGYDFYGIREYQLGDDLRYIAWRNVAKSPERKFFIIEREEENKTDVLILLDVSMSMAEGYEGKRKFDFAALAISNLSYLIIRNEDRLHLAYFSSNNLDYIKIERYSQVPILLNKLSKIKLSGHKNFKKIYEFIMQNNLQEYYKIIITDRYLNHEDIKSIKEINNLGNLAVIILSSFCNLIYDDIIKLYINYEKINIENLLREFNKYQIKCLISELDDLQEMLIYLYKISKYYIKKRRVLI